MVVVFQSQLVFLLVVRQAAGLRNVWRASRWSFDQGPVQVVPVPDIGRAKDVG